jgi:4-amino-4-deoxy-L-arabinose transferase-like glycosyltransferase
VSTGPAPDPDLARPLAGPSPAASAPGRRRVALEIGYVCLLGLAALVLRSPSYGTAGFHNEDAAGITYNADLLLRGLLPLKDSVEFKGPGAFYLVWAFFAAFGRSLTVLTVAAAFWSVGCTALLYLTGRALYGIRAAGVAALLYTLGSPSIDSIDINYHAWMSLPYIGALLLFVLGLRRARVTTFLASGFVLGLAALIKHQSIVMAPCLGAVLILWPRLQRPEGWAAPRPWAALVAMAAGGVAAFAALGVYYVVRGDLLSYFRTYFLAEAGWHYVAGTIGWNDKLGRVGEGVWGLWEFLAFPTALAGLAIVATLRVGPRLTLRGVLLGLHLVFSFLGASIGFRYFKSYYLQVLPTMALLAALPLGPAVRALEPEFWRGFRSLWRRRLVPALLSVALAGPALAMDLGDLAQIRRERRVARDPEAQKLGRIIRENSGPGERVWVWGRWAWPVYFHADRVAGTPYYKVLELLTTTLTNTWRRPTQAVRFRSDGPWREVIADLQRVRPAFIAVSRNEDYREFKAFKDLLAKDYAIVPDTGTQALSLYRRKDFKLRKPPVAPKKPAVKPGVKPGPKPAVKPLVKPAPKPPPKP